MAQEETSASNGSGRNLTVERWPLARCFPVPRCRIFCLPNGRHSVRLFGISVSRSISMGRRAGRDQVMSALPSIGPAPDIPAMATRIRAQWQSAVDSILVTSRLMHEARTGLNKQQWRQLLSLLPFTLRWVQMLVCIGADSRLTKHASFLPKWQARLADR